MRLQTENLKKMLGKISKCKPNNLLEITNYYELSLNEKGLRITGTDGNNYITVFSEEGKQDEPQNIIVRGDQFTRLINKITSKTIDLKVMGEYLQVDANGTYKCEMFIGEDYPQFKANNGMKYVADVSSAQLIHGISAGKNTKSNSSSDGVLYSYLIRNGKMIAADSIKVSYIPIGLDYELLIPPSLGDLLTALDGEKVQVSLSLDNTQIIFKDSNVTIAGVIAEGASEYPDVEPMFEDSYKHKGVLNTSATLQALDRLKLFIGVYDGGLINLIFTDGALVLSTLSGSNEVIPFNTKIPLPDTVEYRANSEYITQILNCMVGDTYTIEFDDKDSIKFVDGEDAYILATAEMEA